MLSLLLRVLRQEAHELARARNRLNVILVNSVAHSGDLRVHFGPTETLFGDDLVCDRLDDFRSSHEHVARILHHEDKISQRGRVDRTASAWAHDQGDLRDNAGGVDVALEDLCVTRQTVYTLLDASTARVVHANHRRTHKRSLVHDFADLLSVCLGQTTAHSCEVLRVGKDHLSVDGSLACDAAIAWNLLLLHPELNTPVALKHVELHERSLVKEQLDSLASRQSVVGVVLVNTSLATAHERLLLEAIPPLDECGVLRGCKAQGLVA